ncbi:MAG: hypothetical protein ACI4R7_02165 [Oliverpabstia sp.]
MIKIGHIVKIETENHTKPKKKIIKMLYKSVKTDVGFVDFIQKRAYNKRKCNMSEICSSVFGAGKMKRKQCVLRWKWEVGWEEIEKQQKTTFETVIKQQETTKIC